MLPTSPSRGAHGSPAWFELEVGGAVVRPAIAVVESNPSPKMVKAQAWVSDLPSLTRCGASEADGAEGEQPSVPPSREWVVIPASLGAAAARSSGGSGAAHELVWP